MQARNVVRHPLRSQANTIDAVTLGEFKEDVLNNFEHDHVRAAVLVMLKVVETSLAGTAM